MGVVRQLVSACLRDHRVCADLSVLRREYIKLIQCLHLLIVSDQTHFVLETENNLFSQLYQILSCQELISEKDLG